MKYKKIFIISIFVALLLCLLGWFLVIYINSNNKSEGYSTEYIDKRKDEIEKYLGDYEIINHQDANEKTQFPELFYLKYFNNKKNNYETITIANIKDTTITEQINEYSNYLVKQNLAETLKTEVQGSDEIVVWSTINKETSNVKLNEFMIENAKNIGLEFSEIGIYFMNQNLNIEIVKKQYLKELEYIYNTFIQKNTIFRITVFDKTYTVYKENNQLVFEYDELYGQS